jgi:arsenate reductase
MPERLKKKNVLFICIGNTCRSQMAEGYARAYGAKILNASSAGTAALGRVSPEAIEVMKEDGVDVSGQQSDQITREMAETADLVVVLGGCPECLYPDLLADKTIRWPISDPFGSPIEEFRRVRGLIKAQVTDLIIDLSHPNQSSRSKDRGD